MKKAKPQMWYGLLTIQTDRQHFHDVFVVYYMTVSIGIRGYDG
jgi:hypothetical protein